MGLDECQLWCPVCKGPRLFRRRTANHILHLLLAVVTGGIWLIVWFFAACSPGPWRCPSCGSEPIEAKLKKERPSKWSVPGIIILVLVVAMLVAVWCMPLSGSGQAREEARARTLTAELVYLDDIEEIRWWAADDNNVYISFRRLPDDWQAIIRGAAWRGNRAIDFGCHVWAINNQPPGWEPGDPGYLDSVTARYGKVQD